MHVIESDYHVNDLQGNMYHVILHASRDSTCNLCRFTWSPVIFTNYKNETAM